MNYLIDTHILLWARLHPEKLSSAHRDILQSPSGKKCISTISIWEISLKFSIGKLSLGTHTPEDFIQTAKQAGYHILEPTPECLASFYRLPQELKHKDPFDRMLIWQAIHDKYTLLSSDNKMPSYRTHGLKLA